VPTEGLSGGELCPVGGVVVTAWPVLLPGDDILFTLDQRVAAESASSLSED